MSIALENATIIDRVNNSIIVEVKIPVKEWKTLNKVRIRSIRDILKDLFDEDPTNPGEFLKLKLFGETYNLRVVIKLEHLEDDGGG